MSVTNRPSDRIAGSDSTLCNARPRPALRATSGACHEVPVPLGLVSCCVVLPVAGDGRTDCTRFWLRLCVEVHNDKCCARRYWLGHLLSYLSIR